MSGVDDFADSDRVIFCDIRIYNPTTDEECRVNYHQAYDLFKQLRVLFDQNFRYEETLRIDNIRKAKLDAYEEGKSK